MRIAAGWLLVAAFAAAPTDCRPSSTDHPPATADTTAAARQKGDTVNADVNVDGAVHHFEIEGGFWAIRGDDGKNYDPKDGVPAQFQKEGLRVHLRARTIPDAMSFHQVGPIVEIVDIRALP